MSGPELYEALVRVADMIYRSLDPAVEEGVLDALDRVHMVLYDELCRLRDADERGTPP